MAANEGAHLRHVGIRTRDIARTTEFYRHVFGLTVLTVNPDRGALLSDGVFNLTVVPIVEELAVNAPVVEGAEPIHLGFIVPDVVEAFRRCQAIGATILSGSLSRTPVQPGDIPKHSFKVADPNGNVVDVIANPTHWPGVTV